MKKSVTIRSTQINWINVDTTSDAEIARQARQDRTTTLSDRTWQKMVLAGQIAFILPTKVEM